MKILIVIDAQNDFISGVLGTPEAEAAIPYIAEKVNAADENTLIIYTRDTHYANYLDTPEGKKLPIEHCIKDTYGWQIDSRVYKDNNCLVLNKRTFGIRNWDNIFYDILPRTETFEEIELCGFCTDICVISNALSLKSDLHIEGVPITVDAKACAGVTPEKHNAALDVMESCQINVINR